MSTYRFGLLFLPRRKKDHPGPAISHLYLKILMRQNYRGKRTPVLLTPQCLTFSELRGCISALRRELDQLEKLARRKYTADQKRQGLPIPN